MAPLAQRRTRGVRELEYGHAFAEFVDIVDGAGSQDVLGNDALCLDIFEGTYAEIPRLRGSASSTKRRLQRIVAAFADALGVFIGDREVLVVASGRQYRMIVHIDATCDQMVDHRSPDLRREHVVGDFLPRKRNSAQGPASFPAGENRQ